MGFLTRLTDRLLDASIYFSFDRSGFERHARGFEPEDLEVDLSGRRVLVTGANSGIGRAASEHLAELGAEVWLLCRDQERGREALEELRSTTGIRSTTDTLRLELLDLADPGSLQRFSARLGGRPVHALVHNAGALLGERRLTDHGLEVTWTTHVVGPFLLTRLLLPNLEAGAPSRIVHVTSGGMYTQRLDLSDLSWEERDFDGVVAYARAKRAQVVLTSLWAERLDELRIDVHAMHPGWVDTPGVRESLPRFWRFTKDRLRTPSQGADTIVWLVAAERLEGTTGKLFFDRREVSEHLLPWTRESEEERRELWELCREQAGVEGTSSRGLPAAAGATDPLRSPSSSPPDPGSPEGQHRQRDRRQGQGEPPQGSAEDG